jgi:hypothetical protein
MPIGFVIAYRVASLGVGFYATTKVHNASDDITVYVRCR